MNCSHDMQRVRVSQNSWKSALTKQILNLEDNLAQLYQLTNLKYNRIVVNQNADESSFINDPKDLIKNDIGSFEQTVDDYLNEVERSATTIGTLINCDSEFDLPIPVIVLLKLSFKIGLLRWPDYSKKIPGTMAKRHIYNKTSMRLLQISLTMLRWISSSLATDILPFQSLVNEFNLNLLEWTRASHLDKHDGRQYCWIRSLVFNNIAWELAQFSINLNYGPEQLKLLIGIELVDEVSKVLAQRAYPKQDFQGSLDDKYVCDALDCLDWLFISYSRFLDAQVEFKLKNYIIHTCLDVYRNFEKNTISSVCRYHLLRLLVTMANQPYACSTSELAWHIIDLASKMETDLEIVLLTRRSLELGLAHRPSFTTIQDYYALKLNSDAEHDLRFKRAIELGAGDQQDLEHEGESAHERAIMSELRDNTEPEAQIEPEPPIESEPRIEPELHVDSEPDAGPREFHSELSFEPKRNSEPSPVDSILSLFVNKPAN